MRMPVMPLARVWKWRGRALPSTALMVSGLGRPGSRVGLRLGPVGTVPAESALTHQAQVPARHGSRGRRPALCHFLIVSHDDDSDLPSTASAAPLGTASAAPGSAGVLAGPFLNLTLRVSQVVRANGR